MRKTERNFGPTNVRSIFSWRANSRSLLNCLSADIGTNLRLGEQYHHCLGLRRSDWTFRILRKNIDDRVFATAGSDNKNFSFGEFFERVMVVNTSLKAPLR